MDLQIKIKLHNNHLAYYEIEDDMSLRNVYNLVINNIWFQPKNRVEYLYYGVYYDLIKKDRETSLRAYIISIKYYNDYRAMLNLCWHIKREKSICNEL